MSVTTKKKKKPIHYSTEESYPSDLILTPICTGEKDIKGRRSITFLPSLVTCDKCKETDKWKMDKTEKELSE